MTNQRDNNLEPALNDCQAPKGTNSQNIDPVPLECADSGFPPTQKRVPNVVEDWKIRPSMSKWGIGQQANCDPLMTGQILNDPDNPNRNVIYRYSRTLRGANEAMLDLFRNIYVLDEAGKAHLVTIMWASQERAVAAILQDNVRNDNSLVVDRIRLPMLAIWANGYALDQSRFTYQRAQSLVPWLDKTEGTYGFKQQEKYEADTVMGITRGIPVDISYTLYAWALYQNDMDQILEQVLLRFSPVAYIKVRGVYWEIIVTLDSQSNNLDVEPGDKKLRVIKFEFAMTAKSYVAQPITRYKKADGTTITPQDLPEILKQMNLNL